MTDDELDAIEARWSMGLDCGDSLCRNLTIKNLGGMRTNGGCRCRDNALDVPDLVAEVRRLRKLFDDAGQGEHNVLELIGHYHDEALEAERIVACTRKRLASVADLMTEFAYQELSSALELP